MAFTSNRDGNEEIYVMRTDGGEVTRLTRSAGIDTSPAWSPDGLHIAFTSARTGSPQIWVMQADGANQRALTHERYCDRPTWSPAPYDEIAYVSRTKTGFDIKVIEVGTGAERQLTFGRGFNESPAWSPSGRHLAFCSTRSGTQQIWTMTRTGEDLRQVTRIGANSMPAWSR
jgi:TolB protein